METRFKFFWDQGALYGDCVSVHPAPGKVSVYRNFLFDTRFWPSLCEHAQEIYKRWALGEVLSESLTLEEFAHWREYFSANFGVDIIETCITPGWPGSVDPPEAVQ